MLGLEIYAGSTKELDVKILRICRGWEVFLANGIGAGVLSCSDLSVLSTAYKICLH